MQHSQKAKSVGRSGMGCQLVVDSGRSWRFTVLLQFVIGSSDEHRIISPEVVMRPCKLHSRGVDKITQGPSDERVFGFATKLCEGQLLTSQLQVPMVVRGPTVDESASGSDVFPGLVESWLRRHSVSVIGNDASHTVALTIGTFWTFHDA